MRDQRAAERLLLGHAVGTQGHEHRGFEYANRGGRGGQDHPEIDRDRDEDSGYGRKPELERTEHEPHRQPEPEPGEPRISDAIYRQLVRDAQAIERGPGGHLGATTKISAANPTPTVDSSIKPQPGPRTKATPAAAQAS